MTEETTAACGNGAAGVGVLRADGRRPDQLRPVRIVRGYMPYAEGSVLIELGGTRVICTASVDARVPPFLKGTGRGWVTAEYSMLPRATKERNPREVQRGHQTGRSMEIQRLIGRALRAVTVLEALGERAVVMDCDVIQADGGTRTAAVTGGFVALVDALAVMARRSELVGGPTGGTGGAGPGRDGLPLRDYLAATSVGVVGEACLLDLAFEEDSAAEVDMNLVMTGKGRIVEVQGTGEGRSFTRAEMDRLLGLAKKGVDELVAAQKEILGELAEAVGCRWVLPAGPGGVGRGAAAGGRARTAGAAAGAGPGRSVRLGE